MKSRQKLFSGYLKIPVVILSALLLGACGGGGSGGSVAVPADNQVAKTTVPLAAVTSSSVSTPVATGSIDLAWTAPAARADGTPLSLADISGYRIYYGTSAGKYTNSADVPDGTATSTRVTGVPVGDYYLVMTTYDVNGLESGFSPAIKKTAL